MQRESAQSAKPTDHHSKLNFYCWNWFNHFCLLTLPLMITDWIHQSFKSFFLLHGKKCVIYLASCKVAWYEEETCSNHASLHEAESLRAFSTVLWQKKQVLAIFEYPILGETKNQARFSMLLNQTIHFKLNWWSIFRCVKDYSRRKWQNSFWRNLFKPKSELGGKISGK